MRAEGEGVKNDTDPTTDDLKELAEELCCRREEADRRGFPANPWISSGAPSALCSVRG